MKILFLGRRFTDFRNFDSVVRELAARGHHVHLTAERTNAEGLAVVETLAAECPAVTYGESAQREPDRWSWAASRLRGGIEHLRYQHRMFDDTPKLRDRSRERTPTVFVEIGDKVRRYAPWSRRPITALLQWIERAVPESPAIRDFLHERRPDVVLITPLIGLGSSQVDYVRTARSLGIPTALCVWSWDHLSSKALIRDMPDRVFVWNDTQRREATAFHRVPAGRIVVTGAQCFDKWFGRRPSRDADTFRRDAGLPVGRPYLLYVCSAPFIGSRPEAPFVAEWIRRVRESGLPHLGDTPILVRPHPSRREEWDTVDLGALRDVVLFGSPPIDETARADYFDSLYHSTAVVGLNTSAFIEAGIIGRPVHTILLPEWHENQLGTVHFRYLFEAGGGLLTGARSFDEHLQQLEAALAQPSTEVRPFVREFVRPHGLDVAATPLFVTHVEEMAGIATQSQATPVFARLAGRLLERFATWRDDPDQERWLHSERELETLQRMHALHSRKAEERRELRRRRKAEQGAREAMRNEELAAKKAEEPPAHPASR